MVGTKRPAPDNSLLRALEYKAKSASSPIDANIEFFSTEMTLTSAAAGTAVVGLSAQEVGNRTVKILGFRLAVSGGTLWATVTNVDLQDTSGTTIFSVAVAGLTANRIIEGVTAANVTAGAAFQSNFGKLTAGRGLQIKANANGTGSDIQLVVYGILE